MACFWFVAHYWMKHNESSRHNNDFAVAPSILLQPENILMAGPGSDQIRICDFGNAMKLEAAEAHYCKHGTPEYVAPEIVNQTPVSKATDIW